MSRVPACVPSGSIEGEEGGSIPHLWADDEPVHSRCPGPRALATNAHALTHVPLGGRSVWAATFAAVINAGRVSPHEPEALVATVAGASVLKGACSCLCSDQKRSLPAHKAWAASHGVGLCFSVHLRAAERKGRGWGCSPPARFLQAASGRGWRERRRVDPPEDCQI